MVVAEPEESFEESLGVLESIGEVHVGLGVAYVFPPLVVISAVGYGILGSMLFKGSFEESVGIAGAEAEFEVAVEISEEVAVEVPAELSSGEAGSEGEVEPEVPAGLGTAFKLFPAAAAFCFLSSAVTSPQLVET